MPLCFITTNLAESSLPSDLEETLIDCIARVLNKPKERISVVVNAGARMTLAGLKDKGFMCDIHSIGVFDETRNPAYFPPLFECLTKITKLPPNRIVIKLVDLPAHMVKTGS